MQEVPDFIISLINPSENSNYIQALSTSYEFSQSQEGLEWSIAYIQSLEQKNSQISTKELSICIMAFSTIKNIILNNYFDLSDDIKQLLKEILFNHPEIQSNTEQFYSFFSSAQSTFVIRSLINDWQSFFPEFLSPDSITSSFVLNERINFMLEFLSQLQKEDNAELIEFLEESEQESLILDFVLNALDYNESSSLNLLNLCLSFMQESLLSNEAILLKISESISQKKFLIQSFDCLNTILYRNVSKETKEKIASTIATPEILQEILSSISQESQHSEEEEHKIHLTTNSSYDDNTLLFTISMTISALSNLSLESYSDLIVDIFSNGFLSSIEVLSPKIEQIVTSLINEHSENESELQGILSPLIEPTFLALCKYYEDDEFFSNDYFQSILTIMNKIFYNGKNISLILDFFTEVLRNIDPNDGSHFIYITSITNFISFFFQKNEESSLFLTNNDIATTIFPIISEFFFIFDARPPFENYLLQNIMKDVTYYLTYLPDFDFSPLIHPLIEIITTGVDSFSLYFCKIIENNTTNLEFYDSFITDTITSGNEYLIRSASTAISRFPDAFEDNIFQQCFQHLLSQLDFQSSISSNEFDQDFDIHLRFILAFIEEVPTTKTETILHSIHEELNNFFQQMLEIEFSNASPYQNNPLANDQTRSLFVNCYFKCYRDSNIDILWKLFTESLDQPLTISTFITIFKQIIKTNEQIIKEFPAIFELCEETFSRNCSLLIDVDDEIESCLSMVEQFTDFISDNKAILTSFDETFQARFLDFYESLIKTEYKDLKLFGKVINFFSILIQDKIVDISPELLQSISFYSWNFYCNINFTIEDNQELINSIIQLHSLLLISDERISEICNEQILQGLIEIGVELNLEDYIKSLIAFSQEKSQENYDNIIIFFKTIYDQRLQYTLKEDQKYVFL